MVLVYYCCCIVGVMIHSSGSSGLLTFSYSSLLDAKGKYLAVSFLSSFSLFHYGSPILVCITYSMLRTESPITLVLHSHVDSHHKSLAAQDYYRCTMYGSQTAICQYLCILSAISAAEILSVSLL